LAFAGYGCWIDFQKIGHSLFSLVAGVIGGLLALFKYIRTGIGNMIRLCLIAIGMWCLLAGGASERVWAGEATKETITGVVGEDGVLRIALLPPGEGNPRNSEGDFITLMDGAVLFVYTHFVTQGLLDDGAAHLASRISKDGGVTWSSEDVVVVPNEGKQNIMSASLLRLADGRIALFYMRKNSGFDCRPMMRISTDEAQTWSEPRLCIPDKEMGYYVMNNDRVIQLKDGRLLLPVAWHRRPGQPENAWDDRVSCWLSDDMGQTWRRSQDERAAKTARGGHISTQEPGVVELKDGRVMLFCRTDAGSQYVSYSADGGDSWSPLEASAIRSPLSPATIEPAFPHISVSLSSIFRRGPAGDGVRVSR
jgi:hypothetical protein